MTDPTNSEPVGLGPFASLAGCAAIAVAVAGIDALIGHLAGPDSEWTLAEVADASGLTAFVLFFALVASLLLTRALALFVELDPRATLAALASGTVAMHVGLALARLGKHWVPLRGLWPAAPLGVLAALLG